jgi:hypothetical protein
MDSQESVRRLIVKWAGFVNTAVRGYEDGIYDYLNDLTIRDQIEASLVSSPSLPYKISEMLQNSDDRLRSILVPVRIPLNADASPTSFWYFGLPVHTSPELANEAKSLGCL